MNSFSAPNDQKDPDLLISVSTSPTTLGAKEDLDPDHGLKSLNKHRSKRLFILLAVLLIGLTICSVGWVYNKRPVKIIAAKPMPATAKMDTVVPKVVVPEIKSEAPLVTDTKEKQIRKHWTRYITANNSNYAYGVLGGINNLSIIFHNRSDYPINEITAKVTYIKANGKPWKSKFVSVFNIPPQMEQQQSLPKVNRGKSVEVHIVKAVSKKLQFKYEEGKSSGIPDDPYFMK